MKKKFTTTSFDRGTELELASELKAFNDAVGERWFEADEIK